MIGMVLVTHGALANALRDAMEHVVGKQTALATVCIESDAEIEGQRAEIAARMAEVNSGDGVILLTDMFGGTPSNLAMSMLNQPDVEVIGGVNLPMLVKLAKVRGSQSLAESVQCAETAGRKYITSGHEIQQAAHNGNGACRAAG
ncbi:MAG: PTS fructose transporter subunit IIA [Acidocella sp. 20-57-95]|nr:MAG: PTS fructose transporter subunit IIA [Acidocella sp. 20-57-95]OYV58717.1 MAG: PTS fructose transporter subunit IIA [Acidocella sp. 21-58-7]HQT65141.1 PTS sugar transporter subunit IIA [Acidocella sp.]HQU03577.1 PTS sugar transporter subunit IIA [Acidocella sp.]